MRIMGIPTTGPAVKIHISSEMARELTATYQTMYHLWFLPSPSSSQESLSANKENRDIEFQYEKEVEVRMESFGETRCKNPQK